MTETNNERSSEARSVLALSNLLLDAARGSQHSAAATRALVRRFVMSFSSQNWEIALRQATLAGLDRNRDVILPEIDRAFAYRIRKYKDIELAASIYNRIPLHTELLQRAGLESARLCVRFALERQRQDFDPVAFTYMQCGLAMRLLQAGRFTSAHRQAHEALRFIRHRYENNPSGTTSAYVEALEAYAVTAHARGKHRVSLQTRRVAIQVLRHEPGAERSLAQSLSNLAGDLDKGGEVEEALAASREAVSLYRDIVALQPSTPQTDDSTGLQAHQADARWDFAAALAGLGNRLIDANYNEEALEIAKESTTVAEGLRLKAPEEATALAAMAHFNLGRTLSKLGNDSKALREMEEADQMFSILYSLSPLRHAQDYGVVLRGLAFIAMERKDYATAASYTQRQVDIYTSSTLRRLPGIAGLALNAVAERFIFEDAQGLSAERGATLERLHGMAREYGVLVQRDKIQPEWVFLPLANLKGYTKDLIEEFVKVRIVPGIDFRTVGDDRVAWVSGADEVWRIMKGVQDEDREQWSEAQVTTAFTYHQTYPAEIDALIARQG
jgi:tetratricopeptide (TPR) repeat protein